MRGLYINSTDFKKYPQMVGIENKIKGQINAYKSIAVDMDYISLSNDFLTINGQDKINLSRYKSQYIILNKFYTKIYSENIIDLKKYDFVYIRFSMSNIGCLSLSKYLKKLGVKVFLEIPTYPYQVELEKNIKNSIMKLIDNSLWRKYHLYIYRLVLTNDLKELYRITAINIFNGINIDNIPKVTKNIKDKKQINLIAVANISYWHGYDRLINGIYKYKNSNNEYDIKFYLVGDGVEKSNLIKIVEQKSLQDNVKFLGVKRGNELDEVFNNMDIGVSSLALFRAGGGHDPIKSKEYVGRGLPVIIGYNDRALNNKHPFVYQLPSDESDVDMYDIIKRYYLNSVSNDEIREFAKNNLSWKSQMEKIIDSLSID